MSFDDLGQSFPFRHISLLGDLLMCSDMELRIAAGEAIALLYDLNRYIDEVRQLFSTPHFFPTTEPPSAPLSHLAFINPPHPSNARPPFAHTTVFESYVFLIDQTRCEIIKSLNLASF